jgi:dynein heavy chain
MVKTHLVKHKSDNKNAKTEENIQKLINEYTKLDSRLTDKLNEAKDNVKYLTTLEKFIDPLYNGQP